MSSLPRRLHDAPASRICLLPFKRAHNWSTWLPTPHLCTKPCLLLVIQTSATSKLHDYGVPGKCPTNLSNPCPASLFGPQLRSSSWQTLVQTLEPGDQCISAASSSSLVCTQSYANIVFPLQRVLARYCRTRACLSPHTCSVYAPSSGGNR